MKTHLRCIIAPKWGHIPAHPINGASSYFKILAKYSDENVVEQWSDKCYFQYLSGMQIFTHPIPCVPTELITFSRQIGDSGAELILKENIQINRTNDDDNFGYAISLYSTI